MTRGWRAGLILAAGLSVFAAPAASAEPEASWLDHAIRRVEHTGQVTVIHRRFCRHIELRCPALGVDVKFVAIRDEEGEHDLSVVQNYPKVVIFFHMDKDSNILFAMHADGSLFRVIKIDVVSDEHIDLPADAQEDLFNRERAFWQNWAQAN